MLQRVLSRVGQVAERVGFEPTDLAVSGFQDRRIRPLCHLSVARNMVNQPGLQATEQATSPSTAHATALAGAQRPRLARHSYAFRRLHGSAHGLGHVVTVPSEELITRGVPHHADDS